MFRLLGLLGLASFFGSTISLSNSSPTSPTLTGMAARDYSQDLYNFNDVARTLNTMGANIGIPIAAISNLDVQLPHVLEIGPLDLCLVPCDYFLDRERGASRPSGLIALEERKLKVICTEASELDPEWLLVAECKKAEALLLEFLVDLRERGSCLAVPKRRLDKAVVVNSESLKDGFYTCVPTGGHTTCAGSRPPRTLTSMATTLSERSKTSMSAILTTDITSINSSLSAVTTPNPSATASTPRTTSAGIITSVSASTSSMPLSSTNTSFQTTLKRPSGKIPLQNSTRTGTGSGAKTAWNTTTVLPTSLNWHSVNITEVIGRHSMTFRRTRPSNLSHSYTVGQGNSTRTPITVSKVSSFVSKPSAMNTTYWSSSTTSSSDANQRSSLSAPTTSQTTEFSRSSILSSHTPSTSSFDLTSSSLAETSAPTASSAGKSLPVFQNALDNPIRLLPRGLDMRSESVVAVVRSAVQAQEKYLEKIRTTDLYTSPSTPTQRPPMAGSSKNLDTWATIDLYTSAPTPSTEP